MHATGLEEEETLLIRTLASGSWNAGSLARKKAVLTLYYCIKVLGSSLGRQPEGWLGSWTRPTSHRRHVKAAETVKFWLAQLKSSYPLTSKPLWRSTACRLPVTAHVGTFAMPTSKRSVTAPEMLRKLQTCSRAVPGRRRQGLGGKLS